MTIFDSIRYPITLPFPNIEELVNVPTEIFTPWITSTGEKLTEADYIELKRLIYEYEANQEDILD